ncbi:hypothetical protein B0H14DRAFT_89667 [Mycena olivaceomarginata]|nr:hypothetical protein B0H14DRAFT_89667 [Mycena olivaceomarginata]
MPVPRSRPVRLWTPRLREYQDDARVFEAELFQIAFQECLAGRASRARRDDGLFLLGHLQNTLDEENMRVQLDQWLTFTLGAAIVENIPDEAMRDCQLLFLRVLFIRYLHHGSFEGDKMAYKLLEEAQMSNYRQYLYIYDDPTPADFSWTEELDLRETRHDDGWIDWMDEDDGEVQGNDEDDDGDEYLPDAGDSSENEEEEMLPRFVKSVRKPRSLPPKALLQPQADTVQLAFFWVKNMYNFFYGQGDKPDSEIIVDDLVAMRHLKPEQYRTPAFLSTLETSGLFSLMRKIARPGNLLETSHPNIEASFLDHDWKLSYSELICSWVEPTVSTEDYEKSQIPLKPDPEYFFDSSDAQDLLEFIEENPRMHPWGFNPMAAFVFYSLHCFRANCDRWLVPCLQNQWLEP